MYCSHCGKKVEDRMLFCPFCGEPIVIPEQDDEPAPAEEAAQEQPSWAPVEAPQEPDAPEEAGDPVEPETDGQPGDAARELLSWNRERRSYAGAEEEPAPEEKQDFRPLELDDVEDADGGEDWREEIARRKREGAPEKRPPEVSRRDGEPARLDGRAPKLEESAESASKAHRSAHTYVPPKALDPDDLFMDGKEDKADRYDEYDAYDEPDEYDAYDDGDDEDEDDYVYEDEAEGNFFMRHIRGIVGLTLLVVLALMFAIYAASDSGQRSLAKANLAWKADVYGALGYQYYNEQRYEQSGLYYERALARKPDSYSYASSAAMAYYTGNNKDKATALLKKCIEIDPSRVEPYIYLLNLYPDAAQRPYDVTRLIQSGYQTTLDSRLKIDQ